MKFTHHQMCLEKTTYLIENEVVGAARFELTTSASQTQRSTRLSYAPCTGGTS